MHVNLSMGDAMVSLLLGFFGSLFAAYFYLRVPRWSAWCASKLADRSRRSAHKRVLKLMRELDQIEHFNASAIKYSAWGITILARMIFLLAGTIIAVAFFGMTIIVEWLDNLESETLGREVQHGYSFYSLIEYTMAGFIVGVLILSLRRLSQLERFEDIEERQRFIKKEIAELSERWNLNTHRNEPKGSFQ